jgi:predicted O-methyltransferase YrrM
MTDTATNAGAVGGYGPADPRVTGVLDEVFGAAERGDQAVIDRAYRTAAEWRTEPTPSQAAELCKEAALPVHRDTGRLLYTLARSLRPALAVEFGTSFGVSMIYLASALRDNGAGRVIGSEIHPEKAERARANLRRAGVAEVAEIRVGDAREQLAELPGPVDLLLLDGWKELYLPVLRLLRPALREGALVVSDNLPMLPEEFTRYVRSPENGFTSLPLPVGDGIELSVHTARRA